MRNLGQLLSLALVPALLSAAETPSRAGEDYVRITAQGTLHHGVAAIGGETTGTTITAEGMTFELELGEAAKLVAAAERLDGKRAVVVGRLTRTHGVETGTRWIIRIEKLRAATPAGGGAAAEEGRPDLKELKELLAEGSGTSAKVIEEIATSTQQPKFSDFESQTLTAILLALPLEEDAHSDKAKQFHYEGPVKPQDLLREIWRVRRLGPLEVKPDSATFLHADRITDIRLRRDEGALRGTVSFRAPGLYAGEADFVARPSGDSLSVVEFSLPAYGIRTRLESTGKWKLVEAGPLAEPRGR